MGHQARKATGTDALTVLADRGYFSGPEVLACEEAGIVPILPKPLTSSAKADGRWGKQDFVYQPESDTYRCPAGETMTRRFSSPEHGMTLHGYATPACRSRCTVKANCTASIERRIKRWEHEEVIEAMQARLDRMPGAMRVRRRTVEHVFGTLKDWMGRSHFKMRRLRNVATEASLHILAYNIKRAIALLGTAKLIEAMQAEQALARDHVQPQPHAVLTQPRWESDVSGRSGLSPVFPVQAPKLDC
jgi:transposase